MEEEYETVIKPGAGTERLKTILKEMSGLPEKVTDDVETDERQDIELDRLRVQVEQQKEELEGKRQDRLQRGDFSYHIFVLLWFYLICVLGIVVSVASRLANLSDTVLCMLLGTTTVNVIGIFNFVAKYLFHTKD